jgi:hypothetical protein
MGTAKKIDQEINQYLMRLTDRQKEAVLTVVKTFAEESGTVAYSDNFKKELDSRYNDYVTGGELISEAEAEARINAIIQRDTKA